MEQAPTAERGCKTVLYLRGLLSLLTSFAAIVFKAIENFKAAKSDLAQFNMNKSEISDDSRLFKIQGDLNLIDHEITSVPQLRRLNLCDCADMVTHVAGLRRLECYRTKIDILGRRNGPHDRQIRLCGSYAEQNARLCGLGLHNNDVNFWPLVQHCSPRKRHASHHRGCCYLASFYKSNIAQFDAWDAR